MSPPAPGSFEEIPRPLRHATDAVPVPPAPSAVLFEAPAGRGEGRPREAPRRNRAATPAVAIAVASLAFVALLLGIDRSGQPLGTTVDVGRQSGRDRGAGGASERRDRMSADVSIGQHLVVGWRGSSDPPPWLLSGIRRGRIGGVILFAENAPAPTVAGFAETTKLLRSAARAGDQPAPLIAVDQEGGEVRRLDAPPYPSAAEMGSTWRTVFGQARAAGRTLRAAGIAVNLAPVADLATSLNMWEADRAFGSRPAEVAVAVAAFVAGLDSAGVAATLKHYPGLGYAEASTDDQPVTIGADATRLAEGELPFEAGIAAGAEMVMLSSAVYRALDSSSPALMSEAVVDRLRRGGFTGVTITDDLAAPALAAYGPNAAVRAVAAGCDLLLAVGRPGPLIAALRRALEDGRIDRGAWRESTRRIRDLKESFLGASQERR